LAEKELQVLTGSKASPARPSNRNVAKMEINIKMLDWLNFYLDFWLVLKRVVLKINSIEFKARGLFLMTISRTL
jgi:hypothetical protein